MAGYHRIDILDKTTNTIIGHVVWYESAEEEPEGKTNKKRKTSKKQQVQRTIPSKDVSILHVEVADDHKSKGIGSLLMLHAILKIWKDGGPIKIHLDDMSDNALTKHSIYYKLGFRIMDETSMEVMSLFINKTPPMDSTLYSYSSTEKSVEKPTRYDSISEYLESIKINKTKICSETNTKLMYMQMDSDSNVIRESISEIDFRQEICQTSKIGGKHQKLEKNASISLWWSPTPTSHVRNHHMVCNNVTLPKLKVIVTTVMKEREREGLPTHWWFVRNSQP